MTAVQSTVQFICYAIGACWEPVINEAVLNITKLIPKDHISVPECSYLHSLDGQPSQPRIPRWTALIAWMAG
eukprot:12303598-Karenia_brevis.AAC.1